MKITLWIGILLVVVLLGSVGLSLAQTNGFDCQDVTEIPTAECDALVALYNSANGEEWDFHPPLGFNNWLTNNQPCSWFGVFCTVGRVTGLDLNPHGMAGSIPPEMSNLTYLFDLSLESYLLTGEIPPELGDLINLHTLTLSGGFSGAIPAELGNLTSLQTLNLVCDCGPLFPGLGNLTNLQELTLGGMSNGSLPAALGNLTNLTILSVVNTHQNGSLPPEMGNLTNLVNLYLYNNEFSGSLPATIGNLASLQYADLSHNQFEGSIPAELGMLSNLEYLDLGSNEISGSLPATMGNLASLQYLDLSHNHLEGSIPAELGMLSDLEELHLNHNRLSGSLPPTLGNVSSLELSDNQFSGTLPPELGNQSFYRLNLHNNPLLVGPIPDSFVMMYIYSFNFGNTSICIPDYPPIIIWLGSVTELEDSGIWCTLPAAIPPEGGYLVSYDGQVEIEFPAGAFTSTAVVTYTQHAPLPTADLAGVNRFFTLEAVQAGIPVTQTLTPMTITVSYGENNPVISGTVRLYRWQDDHWIDEGISHLSDASGELVSQTTHLGRFAVLGETNRVYFPIILKPYDWGP